MHHGLTKTLRGIVGESGVPKASIVEEARGMRPEDRTRPGELVVLDFAKGGRHLIIDGDATTVYRRKERNPLQEGPLKGIWSSMGMHPYKRGVGINFRGH